METNEAVLNRASAVRELLITVKCRKLSYLGHILKDDRYCILQLIMKGVDESVVEDKSRG